MNANELIYYVKHYLYVYVEIGVVCDSLKLWMGILNFAILRLLPQLMNPKNVIMFLLFGEGYIGLGCGEKSL